MLYVDKNPSMVLVNHERIHLDQIKRDGCFAFYYRYFREYYKHRCSGFSHFDAYMHINYEKEAWDNQHNMLYKVS